MKRYCIKLHKLLTPEWTIIVEKVKTPVDPNDEDVDAEVDPSFQYLDAKMTFGRIKNDTDGRRTIAHEFLHLALHGLVINPTTVTEEQTVTRLAKVIEALT
jgi:hypothetical protein